MNYIVFAVVYKNEKAGLECVAVSGMDARSAERRVKGNRPAKIIASWPIHGRAPEWNQERIEGTCDMRDQLAAPLSAAETGKAEEIRTSNQRILEQLGAGSGWRSALD